MTKLEKINGKVGHNRFIPMHYNVFRSRSIIGLSICLTFNYKKHTARVIEYSSEFSLN